MSAKLFVHGACVSVNGRGVLLLGDSGCGKSDLALRLIDAGAVLVADDQVLLREEAGVVLASPAPGLQGLLEARGAGILKLDFITDAPVLLVVRLVAREAVERLPEVCFHDCLGIKLPLLSLHAFDRATEVKIRLVLEGALEVME
ncbi:MAG: HPr kinase/phosphatase C-terminal domain-containing protein [Rickettsiales bacterium]|nr:HPr kinase/phosphatase C-terminal domain-containing protein [Rickettsiales bacterium]